MNIPSINIFKKGIHKTLGTLEAQIMQVLWATKEPKSAREVTNLLSKDKSVSFNAVSTVLNRLEKKEMVKKMAKGKRYSFFPTSSKKEYSQSILTSGLQSLLSDNQLLSAAGISGDIQHNNTDIEAIELLRNFLQNHDEK